MLFQYALFNLHFHIISKLPNEDKPLGNGERPEPYCLKKFKKKSRSTILMERDFFILKEEFNRES